MKVLPIVLFQLFLSVGFLHPMVARIEDFAYPPVMCSDDQMLREKRNQLYNIGIENWKKCIRLDSSITFSRLEMLQRPGVCYDYAMKKLLAGYQITQKIITPGCQMWVKVLPGYFKQVQQEKIKVGDLAVYVMCSDRVALKHFGLVHDRAEPDPLKWVIEGKWGTIKAVFRHTMFSLPLDWGNGVVFFRLKKEYRIPGDLQSKFIGHMKSVLQYPLDAKQILLNKKLELLLLANLKSNAGRSLKVTIIQLLEQFSCVPIDPRNDMDRTPLMLAVLNNDVSLVKLFLSYGADVHAKDMYGKTPLMLAQEKGFVEIQEMLQAIDL
jgi:hypothetical protein